MREKIVDISTLNKILTEKRALGNKIIATSGCFDILHAGHVTYLEEAKMLGDVLVVMLNSDSSVKFLKGKERPIVSQTERSVVIAGLQSVDYVVIFDEETPCGEYAKLQPDIIVKGGDYEGKYIPEMDVVKIYGGEVKYLNIVDGCSTTNIITKIKSSMKG